jgi:hypothetical protein
MPFNPFSEVTSKIFGGLLVLSLLTLGPALWITSAKLADARETITELVNWRIGIVDAIRIAADNPDVDATTAAAQVQALGNIRIELTTAIENQNAAVAEMERQSAEAFRVAQEAERKRAAAIKRADTLAAELRNRARVPAPAADMEAAVRRTQDELYEAGL